MISGLFRSSDIDYIDAKTLVFKKNQMSFRLKDTKANSTNRFLPIILPSIQNKSLCPVETLKVYLSKSNNKLQKLFFYNSTTTNLYRNIVKDCLRKAGIDTVSSVRYSLYQKLSRLLSLGQWFLHWRSHAFRTLEIRISVFKVLCTKEPKKESFDGHDELFQ